MSYWINLAEPLSTPIWAEKQRDWLLKENGTYINANEYEEIHRTQAIFRVMQVFGVSTSPFAKTTPQSLTPPPRSVSSFEC